MIHSGGLRASDEDGVQREARLPGAEVHAVLGVPVADLREQAGEQRAVQGLRGLVRSLALLAIGASTLVAPGRRAQPELAHDVLELAVDLGPLADADEREEALAADAAQVTGALAPSASRTKCPEPEQAHEVGALVARSAGAARRPSAALARALARVLDVEGRRDDEHLAAGSRARRPPGSSGRCAGRPGSARAARRAAVSSRAAPSAPSSSSTR